MVTAEKQWHVTGCEQNETCHSLALQVTICKPNTVPPNPNRLAACCVSHVNSGGLDVCRLLDVREPIPHDAMELPRAVRLNVFGQLSAPREDWWAARDAVG